MPCGRGPAPKDPSQRRRYNQPARSEWVELKPLERPVLPHAGRGWGVNARRAWRAWSMDPVTTQWGPADVFAAQELCRLYDRLEPAEGGGCGGARWGGPDGGGGVGGG